MFDSLTRFTVLIKRRVTPHLCMAALLLPTAAVFAPAHAVAQTRRDVQVQKRLHKMSPDLKAAIDGSPQAKGR